MLATTATNLVLLAVQYVRNISAGVSLAENCSQLVADVVISIAAVYLICAGIKKAFELIKAKKPAKKPSSPIGRTSCKLRI